MLIFLQFKSFCLLKNAKFSAFSSRMIKMCMNIECFKNKPATESWSISGGEAFLICENFEQ